MIKKMLTGFAAVALIAGASLVASCSLTTEQTAAVEKAYNATCSQEPALYQTFVLVATAKKASDKTLARAAAVHHAAIRLCETRPKDVASAAVQLAALYAQLVTISAQVDKLPPPVISPGTS
ncbi:hypothetical protein [Ensifer sp. LCM 4579]|uniref:hypothetical protein n=1 Tax=Ensifer sp. LCM 4579 TaxID=1848292 RepID=UPI0008D92407|nr:hypothetical protein [Ensifer sp. LCM 4579]OHV73350.1 hypothetical protein LCM4579_10540 [Ensifer sp. LCM 4579]